jgi:hypothetical protein
MAVIRLARSLIHSSAAHVTGFALLAVFASARNTEAMCVDVMLQFGQGLPAPTLVESMKEEAARIWEPYGVRMAWVAANDAAGCPRPQVSFDVLVGRQRAQGRKIVLGSTRLTLLPIRCAPILIDYPATEQLLEGLRIDYLLQTVGRRSVAPVDLGRALGRILAHEIGHVVLGAATHQSRGLMRAAFVAQDLIRPQRSMYRLSATEVARLRARESVLSKPASTPVGQP